MRFITIINKYSTFGFFAALLALGIFIHSDYGISLDEPAQRLVGIVNLNYLAQVFGIQSILENQHLSKFSTQSLMQLEDRHYGVIFEIPAALIEVAINPNREYLVFPLRHLLNYIYFLLGVLSLYLLTKLRYKNTGISLLACLILILSPRIFADAFYNGKDIVFLSTFLLASLTMVRFLLSPNWKTGFFHAFASAIAIDTRLIAVAIPLVTVSLLFIRSKSMKSTVENIIGIALLYLLVMTIAVVFLWPYLWTNPFSHFIEAIQFISHHPHSAALTFQGKEVLTSQLPWYYIPHWILISTPILYLVLFGIGFIYSAYRLYKSKFQAFKNTDRLIDLICIGFFIGPILAISVSHTSIYNGWRHLYFLYPFFIVISIAGLIEIWRLIGKFLYGKVFLISVVTGNFLWIFIWMIGNHPLENIYFNSLAGKNWNYSYEVDYWGLANRVALRKILDSDKNNLISIWPGSQSKFVSGEPTVFSDQLMLEVPENKSRVSSPNSPEESKYLIASRNGIYPPQYLSQHGMFTKFDSVQIDGREILSIFLRKNYGDLPVPEINIPISFAQSGEGIFYLNGNKNPPINWELWKSTEWQIPEIWGTWTDGKVATLTIPKPNADVKKLIIKLRAFTSPQIRSQNIQVWINGIECEKLSLENNEGNEFTINLPRSVNEKREIQITFMNLNPQSPKQLGFSRDNRQISIGLESLRFN